MRYITVGICIVVLGALVLTGFLTPSKQQKVTVVNPVCKPDFACWNKQANEKMIKVIDVKAEHIQAVVSRLLDEGKRQKPSFEEMRRKRIKKHPKPRKYYPLRNIKMSLSAQDLLKISTLSLTIPALINYGYYQSESSISLVSF